MTRPSPKHDPYRDRERMIMFFSTLAALACIFGLRFVIDQNWAIMIGIFAFFLVGITLEDKITKVPMNADDEEET